MLDKFSDAIEARAVELLDPAAGGYTSQIWNFIKDTVINKVIECAEMNGDDGFTDGDISFAIGQALIDRMSVMTPNEYQEEAMKTCSIRKDAVERHMKISLPMLTNAMLGLCGEAGECADLVKKHLYQGHDLDRAHMAKELGDVAWYLAEAAEAIGYDLEDIFRINIRKLRARYPEGHFDAERSLHRSENDI